MADLISDFLQGPFYYVGNLIWNMMMTLISGTMSTTPMDFSENVWGYIATQLYPLTLSIGTMLLNLFFFVGFFRQASNLKQNFTLEVFVECGIRVVFGNALMVSGMTLMQLFFRMASALCNSLLVEQPVTFAQEDVDVSSSIFYWTVFGILYLCVCLTCSFMVFLSVYGRYLQLYLLVVTAPLALGALPGGPGVSQTSAAWVRTFLLKTFEIVLIALALVIGSRMCQALSFLSMEGEGAWALFDGQLQAIQNMATMILLTASVKGADSFMRRTFAL